jgi:hypothetical protein
MRVILPAVLLLLTIACADPKVDTSTDEAMSKSMSTARESLPPERRAEFDAAVQTLTVGQIDFAAVFAGNAPDAEAMARDFKTALNGKTAEEIIAAAEQARAAQKEKERQRALAEIGELVKEQQAAAEAKKQLAQFVVLRSKFSRERNYIGITEPKIALRVRNDTGLPVSRAYFHGKVTSPGRSVPWISEDFHYTIRGGIEPGEEAEWSLEPYTGWHTEVPPEAGLEVEVVRLDGADGEALFDAAEFTEEDEARLAALRKEYGAG